MTPATGVGDPEAFGQIYAAHVEMIRRYTRRRIGCQHLAEDVVSETFLRAFQHIESFVGGNLEAWLTRIAGNLVSNHYRLASTQREIASDDVRDPSHYPAAEQLYLRSLELQQTQAAARRARAAIEELTEDQRRCLTLRYLEGCNVAETAAAMSRTPGAVRVLQNRAVRAMRSRLEHAAPTG